MADWSHGSEETSGNVRKFLIYTLMTTGFVNMSPIFRLTLAFLIGKAPRSVPFNFFIRFGAREI
jgi:hypothetical protein